MPYKNPADRRAHRALHAEENRAHDREYYAKNRERKRGIARESYWKNVDSIRQREHQWKLNHPNELTKSQRYEAKHKGYRRRHGSAAFFYYRHPGYTQETVRVGPLGDVRVFVMPHSNATIRQYHAHTRKWAKKNHDRVRYNRIEKVYGISKAAYLELAREQDWRCAICQTKPKDELAVDHNHITKAVRGLLCDPCNLLLGRYEKYGMQIQSYLRKYS